MIVLEASTSSMVTCALRPSVLCGPGDYQLIPAIHACIAKWETPYIIGDGFNLWDVTYVTNVADAHVLAAENLVSSKTAAGETFFIQNNEPITFRDFCLAIWAHFGHLPPFEVHIPVGLAWLAGLLSEFVTWMTGSTTTLSRGSVRDACSVRYASGEKARQILSYEARVGIVDGIRLSCEVRASRNFCNITTFIIELPAYRSPRTMPVDSTSNYLCNGNARGRILKMTRIDIMIA
jgi:sterol-4alpha-carboxylate 3-dehydrogenase (decarboxylating)